MYVCIYVRVNTDRLLTNGGCACRWAMGSRVAIMTGREIESVEVAGSLEKRFEFIGLDSRSGNVTMRGQSVPTFHLFGVEAYT